MESGEIRLDTSVAVESTNPVSAKFSLKYLCRIVQAASLAETVKLCIADNRPLSKICFVYW